MGGFWNGVYKQKLSATQAVGLLILVVIYVGAFVLGIALQWPSGEQSFWQKILYGYGPYLLLSLPLVFFFLLLCRRIRPPKQTHTPGRQ